MEILFWHDCGFGTLQSHHCTDTARPPSVQIQLTELLSVNPQKFSTQCSSHQETAPLVLNASPDMLCFISVYCCVSKHGSQEDWHSHPLVGLHSSSRCAIVRYCLHVLHIHLVAAWSMSTYSNLKYLMDGFTETMEIVVYQTFPLKAFFS